MNNEKHHLSKRTKASVLLILIIIPLTIIAGVYWYKISGYASSGKIVYLMSAVVIFETMIPFMLIFEKRKPQARELIVISVLSAIGVAGRVAFYMLPQFKPVCAIVIITGVCFGGEAGFMVGALTGFVSNFFFGQGLYTPFQMFAFGIVGFLAGVLFQKGKLKKQRLPMMIYGGLSVFIIYGALVDISTVVGSLGKITWETVAAIYISGIPFNIVHALATVFFLYILSAPMIEKLERIKIKYGLMEAGETLSIPDENLNSDIQFIYDLDVT